MKKKFDDVLNELNVQGYYPFHMPGHKRNVYSLYDAYKIDITEIDGYDDLHHPQGIIKELEDRISCIYGSYKSYVLVNGSTCGILASITAATSYGDGIIMARNSHKSAYNAVGLRGLYAEYIYPEYIACPGINGAITCDCVKKAIDNIRYSSIDSYKEKSYEACNKNRNGNNSNYTLVNNYTTANNYTAVYITSPTYEGIVSDIKTIADIVHENGMLLIVDEAHGAHFGLSDYFPETAVRQGADIVIQSIHKTLPGMTQTALLHVNEGRVDINKLEYYLSVYQSSSPSYVLMSSVDNAICMIENNGKNLFMEYHRRLKKFYEECDELIHIKLYNQKNYAQCQQKTYAESVDIFLGNVDKVPRSVDKKGDREKKMDDSIKYAYPKFDFGKLVIYEKNDLLTGREIYDYLREKHKLQLEMASGRYCLAMTSICDTDEGMNRLFAALKELDGEISYRFGDIEYSGNEKCIKKQECAKNQESTGKNAMSEDVLCINNGKYIEKSSDYEVCFGQRKNRAVLTIEEAIKRKKKCQIIKPGVICAEYIYVYPPGIPMIVPGEIVENEHICDIINCMERGFEVRGVELTDKGIELSVISE